MKVTIHIATLLQCESILYIQIAFNLSPKVYVLANDVTFHICALTDDNAALADNLSLEKTVYTDIVRGNDLTFNHGACRNPADRIHIDSCFYFCHNILIFNYSC